jgi:hypothetical protein
MPETKQSWDPNPIYKHKATGKNYVILCDVTVEYSGDPAIAARRGNDSSAHRRNFTMADMSWLDNIYC